ncbi:ABC transporter substrate-binding protein [bacterium]|nr:ABC transporter substrate-binding protein [bacterium]
MSFFKSALVMCVAILMFTGCVQQETGSVEQSKYPEIYRFAMDTDAPTLDPAMVTDTVSDKVIRDIFDCLIKFDSDMNYVPVIAESWIAPEAGGTEWIFNLHKGIKFHNGREITAKDVEYSLTRVLDPETASPRTWVLNMIKGAKAFIDGEAETVEGIEVLDNYIIKITLETPFAPFLGCLCMSTCSVIPREEIEKLDDQSEFSLNPIGSGPFMFKKWVPDNEIVLVANPDYFEGAPKLKGVTYRIIKESMARVQEFENGNVEHTDIPPQELDRILEDPVLSKLVVRTSLLDVYHMGFNCNEEPFKDNIDLRKAFNYAVDKEHIANNILKNNMEVAKGYIPPRMPNYKSQAEGYEYSPVVASEYLEKAGYPEGNGLEPITLYIDNDEIHRRIAESVSNDLRKIGVEISIRQMEWGAFLDAVDEGEAKFFQLTWLADYPDPDNFLFVLLHTDNWGKPGNQTLFSNPEFDQLTKQAQIETDWAVRHELYIKAESIVMEECPWLILFTNRCNILVQDYVRDLDITALDRSPRLPNVELEKVWFGEE